MHQRLHRSALALVVVGLSLTLGGCLSFFDGEYDYPGAPYAYVDVRGVRTHYRDMAPPASPRQPETIVMIHGYAGGLVSWFYAQPELARRYRVVSLDLMGFGLTSKPEGDYSTEAHAERVIAFMDRLGIPRAHLMAHSWGCAVALAVAHRHPERVDRLVLASAFVYEDQVNGFLRWSRVPLLGETLFDLFYNEQLEARYTWSYFEPERHVSVMAFDLIGEFQDAPGVKAAALETARHMELAEQEESYRKITRPALLVWGAQDRVSDPRFGERLSADLPQSRLVVLPRAGHAVMLERAGAFTSLTLEFLKR